MSWQIKLYDTRPDNPQVGDCWISDISGNEKTHILLLPERLAIFIDLLLHDVWTVTGDLPNITVLPSIFTTGSNIDGTGIGSYHGYITDGVISDPLPQ